MGNLSNDEKKGKKEYLFYVRKPVAVCVFAKNKREARAIRKRVLDIGVLDEEYVPWFNHIPGVDRTLLTIDPVEPFNEDIQEY